MHGSSSLKWAIIRVFPLNIQGGVQTFFPHSRLLRYRSVKASSDQLRGAHIAQPLFMKSLVLLRSGVHVYWFALHHSVGKALADSFHRKKQYIWPLLHPYPPCMTVWLPKQYGRFIYTSRLTTTQLV